MQQSSYYCTMLMIVALPCNASAGVTLHTNKADWQNDAGVHSTITFAELDLPNGTWLDEQYSFMGIHLTDGSDQIFETSSFVTDGIGLNGALDSTLLQFDEEMNSIALDFPGFAKIQLFKGDKLIYTSPTLGVLPTGNFAGVVSTQSFDKAKLYDPFSGLFIDNIYFGPPIPAPGALTLLALGFTLRGRRRANRVTRRRKCTSVQIHVIALCAAILASTTTSASVTLFSSPSAWQSAAGSYSTITFAELPAFSWITDQYSDLGVSFTDGSDQIDMDSTVYADGFGLNGAFDDTTLEFSQPITSLAFDFPGHLQVQLFDQETLIYTSPILGSSGIGNFRGLVSTQPFDKVHLFDGGLFIDNIHFGPPIPAPGALTLLALGFTLRGRRRRTA